LHSTIEHVRDIESMSVTTIGIVEALASKDDAEDPMVVVVRR
jgi:hypothetical protein